MEDKKSLMRIKSKYILLKIFEYIKNDNIMLKLFANSKLFQNKMNIDLFNYQLAFFYNYKKFNINDYLCTHHLYYDRPEEYDKNELEKKLKDKLFYDKKNLNNSFNYDDLIRIDILSPFFNILAKKEFFKNIFIIPISVGIVEKYNLENIYINAFETINQNYSRIIFNYIFDFHINYLKLLNINWNNIQTLIINEKIQNNKNNNYEYFYKTFFSFKNIGNNLIHLTINLNLNNQIQNKPTYMPNIFEKINNFKLLERLELNGILIPSFTLKLYNLKELYLSRCGRFDFDVNTFLNIKKLQLKDCVISKSKTLIDAPELEICELYNNNKGSKPYVNCNLIFNLKSFQKLKFLKINETDFLHVGNTLIEDLELISESKEDQILLNKEDRVTLIQKILSIKTLKNINFQGIKIYDEDFSQIKGFNESVTKINICGSKLENTKYLPSAFPNLTELMMEIKTNYYKEKTNLEIIEDINSKINKLSIIYCYGNNAKVFCQSFETLIELDIKLGNKIDNMYILPLFKKNCKTIFRSLIKFKLNSPLNRIDYKILKNIYINIECLPNLELIELISISYNLKKYEEEFIRKLLLHKKLKYIVFQIQQNLNSNILYSNNELKNIYPDIDFNKYNCLKIYKNF